jgi:hypothetical protein
MECRYYVSNDYYVFSDCLSHSLWYLLFFQIGSVSSHYVCPCWRPNLSLWFCLMLKGLKFIFATKIYSSSHGFRKTHYLQTFHSLNIVYEGTDFQTYYFTNDISYIKSMNKHNRGNQPSWF